MNFKNKYGDWALITGGTSGIGAEIASQLAAQGLNIILVARKETALQNSAESLVKRYGIETQTVVGDLSTPEGVDELFNKTKETQIGLLVIAAGLEVNGAFEKTDINKEVQLINLNIITTLKLTHHYIPEMVKRGKGGVLLISSLSGHMPNPYFSNYAGSKAYVLNFGASLHAELAPKGVDVTVLSPGLTKTPMVADNGVDWTKTPMKAMEPSLVAEAGINGLGKSMLVVPGKMNKFMAGMAKHSPLKMLAKKNEKMMKIAIDPGRM